MVQRFLPEIVTGRQAHPAHRRRAGAATALARIPQGSEIRGNLAAGGKGVAQPLTARDREIAERDRAARWRRAGCCWSGLDVIGDCLTEINVTSPTCFQEITQQTGFDVAAMFVDALERALA